MSFVEICTKVGVLTEGGSSHMGINPLACVYLYTYALQEFRVYEILGVLDCCDKMTSCKYVRKWAILAREVI